MQNCYRVWTSAVILAVKSYSLSQCFHIDKYNIVGLLYLRNVVICVVINAGLISDAYSYWPYPLKQHLFSKTRPTLPCNPKADQRS